MSGMMEVVGKKDFTAEVAQVIPESTEVLQSKGIDDALALLLSLEKKCRVNNDLTNLKEVCLHMVRLARGTNDWPKLNSTIMVINKRRAQNKIAVSAIVEESMTYIDSAPDIDTRVELIKTLKEVCEGKIYVEGESSRLHMMLAVIYEARGDVAGACDMIQDVHIETYGSLSKKEKAEYILEQIRLNLLKKDLIRALIQSRKMNRKTLEEAGFEEIKVKFYQMMIEYHTHEKDTWEISQCYYKIYDTSTTRDSPPLLSAALEACIAFLVLSKFNNHQSDMLHRLKLLKDTLALPLYSHALTLFTTPEVIPLPFDGQQAIEAHPCLRGGGTDTLQHFIKTLNQRVIEHNLRTVAAYYRRVSTDRLASMLGLDRDTLEGHLSEMSSDADIHVKIDRPAGIVSFDKPRAPEAVLSDWASDMGRLLNIMESTCHLINRENMVHKA